MSQQITIKQHYVSQFYLKYWCDGEHLYCSRNNGTPTLTKTKEVAHKNKMYKLQKLTADEINSFIAYSQSDECPEFVKPLLTDLILLSQKIFAAHHIISFIKDHAARSDITEQEHLLEKEQTNVLEKFFAEIEAIGKSLLNELTPENYEIFFTEEKLDVLLLYTFLQMYRTYKVNEGFKDIDLISFIPNSALNIKGGNIYAIFAIILAARDTDKLVKVGYRVELIINQSDLNIITSDHPVINIAENPSQDVVLYFPLGPKKAITIHAKTGEYYPSIKINHVSNAERIRYFNNAINENKRTDLYASKEEDLRVYVK